SIILSEFENFRGLSSYSIDDLEKFSLDIGLKIKNGLSDKDYKNTEIFIARVDMKSLLIEGLNWGSFQLLSNDQFSVTTNSYFIDESFASKVRFSSKLKRDGHYAILSPGLRDNCQ